MQNTNHPDPYAGQYPRPPPLMESNETEYQPPTYYPQDQHIQASYIPMPQPPQLPSHEYHAPYNSYETYATPPMTTAITIPPQQHHEPRIASPPPVVRDEYKDPTSQPLDAFLRQEREEYLKQKQDVAPRPTVIPLDSYSNSKEDDQLDDEPEKMPIMATAAIGQHEYIGRKERKRLKKQQEIEAQYEPHLARPTYAPVNEADGYRVQPQQESRNSCCCCCYNPAITCCSFFMLLVSCAFLAAGAAMMIASKVVRDKCNNECSNVSVDSIASTCSTICNKVLHDGLLYGGAVVAGLAAIAIIWKLIMWTCAGYSQRR
ncbi:hypothetical protein BD560DRAFT_443717 [Blakeslea trispora]|nr:hypothetical protein BD560DRAFT_443717 [Blakeslea trispora]